MKNLTGLVYNNNAIVEVTKEISFDSAHFLEEYVGKCSSMHGHTFRLHVSIQGTVNEIGMVLDFKDLKEMLKTSIEERFDHAVINEVVKFNPTAENLCIYFFEVIESILDKSSLSCILVSVKLWETPTSYAEFRGDYTNVITK